jgi:transposase-like protein
MVKSHARLAAVLRKRKDKESKRALVRLLSQKGESVRSIAAALNLSKSSVHRWKNAPPLRTRKAAKPAKKVIARRAAVRKLAKSGRTIVGSRGKSGRAQPVVIYRRNFPSVQLIARELRRQGKFSDVSNSTVRRDLVAKGMTCRKKPKGPQRRLPDAGIRVKFAKETVRSNEDFIFSDESMFDCNNCGCATEWCESGEAPHERESYGFAAKVHIWGAIGRNFIQIIHLPDHAITAPLYQRLVLIPMQQKLGPGLSGRVFIQDNAKCHVSNEKYLQGKKVKMVKWPPRSPDLNPIECLWAILKRKIADRGPTEPHELREFVDAEVAALSMETINKLVSGFKTRLKACIKKKGQTITKSDERVMKS